MTKSEMRKALQDGMTAYIGSGKTITKCPEKKDIPKASKQPRAPKEEEVIEIDTQHLPQALKIRFGFQD
jgi:hypothetical protein